MGFQVETAANIWTVPVECSEKLCLFSRLHSPCMFDSPMRGKHFRMNAPDNRPQSFFGAPAARGHRANTAQELALLHFFFLDLHAAGDQRAKMLKAGCVSGPR